MTNEEMIKKLEHYKYCLKFQYGWYGKDDDEAFDIMQKSCEDIEEIKEVMNCDVDAENKCKMISNILTAKPHYFKK